MRTLLSILTLATLATSCGTPKLTNTGEPTATTRYNSGASPQINKPNSVNTVAEQVQNICRFRVEMKMECFHH